MMTDATESTVPTVRRAIVRVDFALLEQALGLHQARLRIVAVLPPDPQVYRPRELALCLEGPDCPIVRQGEVMPTLTLESQRIDTRLV